MNYIQHNSPTLTSDLSDVITNVIQSGWVAQGLRVAEFEKSISNYLNFAASKAVALSNGTSALFLSLYVLGVKSGDEVIIPTYTCSALLNAIFMVGAIPILCDIDECDFNVLYDDLKSKVTKKTKAIIIPHTFGVPSDFSCLNNFEIPIIEDCATAIGASINNIKVGTLGSTAVFSFYASKFLTTGNGGIFVSKYAQLVEKAIDYREFDCRSEYYPRFNFQMSDIQGAIGVNQMTKVESFLYKRKQIFDAYFEIATEKGWDFQKPKSELCKPNNYRFVLKIEESAVLNLMSFLNSKFIKSIVPIDEYELLHNYLGYCKSAFPNAEKIARTSLSLPIYPLLVEDGKIEYIIDKIKEF